MLSADIWWPMLAPGFGLMLLGYALSNRYWGGVVLILGAVAMLWGLKNGDFGVVPLMILLSPSILVGMFLLWLVHRVTVNPRDSGLLRIGIGIIGVVIMWQWSVRLGLTLTEFLSQL